ncbi:MAG: bifunctional DNA primase/polymerase, partial [Terriglobales bacterium]
MIEALEPALSLRWRVFPCAPRDKNPLLKDWPRRASSDADVIRKWAQKYERCNWGVVTGPESGVFAIDVDGESGEESFSSLVDEHGVWTETLAVTTARGRHFYFDWPASGTIRNSAGKLGAGVDVRGDGGYCVIPPSVHPDGPIYRWASANFQTAPAPCWLLETITSAARPAVKAEEIGILPTGTRNDGLARLAGAMRRKGATLPEIETALLEHNVRRCRPPLLDYEVRKIAASVARYAPGGLDPLQVAWQASEGEYGSNYERFLGLAHRLQLARPGHAVALPLQRIASLMGVHWNTISRYRSAAVNAGVLEPSGQYI